MSVEKITDVVGARRNLRAPTTLRERLAVSTVGLAWLCSLIVAHHPWAFMVNPFVSGDPIRTLELCLFWVGWILSTVGAGLIGLDLLLGSGASRKLLPLVALAHPLSILLLQSTLRMRTGNWYLLYLTSNRWLLLSDIFIPILLVLVYVVCKEAFQPSDHNFSDVVEDWESEMVES
jgi:hypothetical protein